METLTFYFLMFVDIIVVTSPITGLIYILYRVFTDKPKPEKELTQEELKKAVRIQQKAAMHMLLK